MSGTPLLVPFDMMEQRLYNEPDHVFKMVIKVTTIYYKTGTSLSYIVSSF